MNKLLNWFGLYTTRQYNDVCAQRDKSAVQYERARATANETISTLKTQVNEFMVNRPDALPWVEILGVSDGDKQGIRMTLDWNDKFIEYLEDNNIKGPTDIAAVQRWLIMANMDMIDKLEQEAIDEDPRGTVSDIITKE